MNNAKIERCDHLRSIALFALMPGGVIIFILSFLISPFLDVMESATDTKKVDISWVTSLMALGGCVCSLLGVLLFMGTILFAPVTKDDLR